MPTFAAKHKHLRSDCANLAVGALRYLLEGVGVENADVEAPDEHPAATHPAVFPPR